MPDFYADKENLIGRLAHYLAVFSEGHEPYVPTVRNGDGTINLESTFALPCFLHFPESEKILWLK